MYDNLELCIQHHVYLLEGHFINLVQFDRLRVCKIILLNYLLDLGIAEVRLGVIYAFEQIAVTFDVGKFALIVGLTDQILVGESHLF